MLRIYMPIGPIELVYFFSVYWHSEKKKHKICSKVLPNLLMIRVLEHKADFIVKTIEMFV